MLIGIDGNEANIENRVGVNMYAYEVIWGLYKMSQEKPFEHRLIVYLKNKPLSDMPKPTKNFEYKLLPGGKVWILTKLMPHLFLASQKPDIIFSPSHYVPPFSPVPRVCSIMDLGYLEFSAQFKKYDYWQLKAWTAISILVSKYIISISEATKKDIVRHYKFAVKKIRVMPLAHDKKVFNPKIKDDNVRLIKKRHSIVNDYILFLSTLKPSKNLDGVLEAFAIISRDYPDLQLVVTGKRGWLYQETLKKVEELELGGKVIFTGFIPEEDKPALLRGAKLLVSPSFWEGFGLHVLESMAVGTPVVVSDRGSLREVVGEAGEIVDPQNAKDIAKGIDKILGESDVKYQERVKRGIIRSQKFDWDQTAKLTLSILTHDV